MSKTNLELVKHAEKALKEGWFYLWGSFGSIATQTLLDSNIRQYPTNETWRSYAKKAIGKTRYCDCYGLVKGYLWWTDDNSNPKYNSAQDMNTSMAYSKSKEKGTLATLPEIKGVILYMQGHVGVYMGNGRFIELMGGGVGAYEGKIENGKIIKGSKFTHWFKDINLSYIEDNTEEVEEENNIEEEKGDDFIMYVKFEDVPDYAKATVKKLMDKGLLKGDEKGNINLTESMLRVFVVHDRANLYD